MLVVVVNPDDTQPTVHDHPDDPQLDVLRLLQEYVGGYIEVAYSTDGVTVWCNEDGIARQLPFNAIATNLIAALGGPLRMYVGPVVITGVDGEDVVSLSDDQIEHLMALL